MYPYPHAESYKTIIGPNNVDPFPGMLEETERVPLLSLILNSEFPLSSPGMQYLLKDLEVGRDQEVYLHLQEEIYKSIMETISINSFAGMIRQLEQQRHGHDFALNFQILGTNSERYILTRKQT